MLHRAYLSHVALHCACGFDIVWSSRGLLHAFVFAWSGLESERGVVEFSDCSARGACLEVVQCTREEP